jgi:glyoxylase-like metal-dependent hydrolase (beta-lactamase superfamily II)
MKVLNLTKESLIYTSNVYLVTGNWNTMSDVNTLIDAGRDVSIIEKINNSSTGVGKQKVEQIILTHSHYDHAEIINTLKKEFKAKIFAFSKNLEGVDKVLKDGEIVRVGDCDCEIIHIPGHSTDSICLYCETEKVLFAGDSPLIIRTKEGCYDREFVNVFKRLVELPIETIYFGHGHSMTGNCNKVLYRSLENINTVK